MKLSRPSAPARGTDNERMRILHLIDVGASTLEIGPEPAGDAALYACRSLVARTRQTEHEICLIGGSNTRMSAEAHALDHAMHLRAGPGRIMTAKPAVRRVIAECGEPDVVHCWSEQTLCLAHAAVPGVPRAATLLQRPTQFGAIGARSLPTERISRWRLGPALRGTALVVLAEDALQAWEDTFGNFRSIDVAPLPSPAELIETERDAKRRSVGIMPDEIVLLLLGQTAAQADAMRFMFLLDVLQTSGCACVGIVPRGASQLARALRFHAGRRRSWRVFVSERPLPDLLRIADVGVCEGDRSWANPEALPASTSATLLIAAAHRAGVPVVAPRSLAVESLYPHEVAEACVAFNASLPELGRKLLPILSDRSLLESVSARASAAAAAIDGLEFAAMVERAWAAVRRAPASRADEPATLPA